MGTYTRAFMQMGSLVGSGSTTGRMVVTSRGFLKMDCVMVRVYGKGVLATATSMKVNMSMIRSQGTVFLLGLREMSTRATMKTTRETVMDRCTGATAATTKVSGRMASSTEQVRFTSQEKGSRKEFLRIMCSLLLRKNHSKPSKPITISSTITIVQTLRRKQAA